MDGALWIFGYGSLIWRPAFPHVGSRAACARGLVRRFWQGSPDHRGVPHAPGRVVTLVAEAGATCWGRVFRVAPDHRDAVLRGLDDRESGGFDRQSLDVELEAPGGRSLQALTYVAPPGNPNFLGPAPLDEMAAQMRRAAGRSGTNVEYVARLAGSLRAMQVQDAHVFELDARVCGDGPAS